ncbi:MAG: FHA domain-containing protein, partial [Frankiaceae bacterium]|nr:FHA domain-containing protein [Frankiaceae bacterium]
MQVHVTLRRRGAPDRDIAIDAPPGATLGSLDSLDPSWSPSEAGWWSGTRRLGPDAAIGGPGLRDGDIIGVGQIGRRDATAGAVLLLQAVGGPGAGGVWALSTGLLIIGRADDADVRLADGDVSRRHASLTVTSAGVRLRDLDSTNGTLVDGAALGPEGALLSPGQLMQLGGTILCLSPAPDAPAALRPHGDGKLLMNRPPRVPFDADPPAVTFPPQPPGRARSSLRVLPALAPAAAGLTMAVLMHSPTFLLFALLSPITLLATWIGDRVSARRGRRIDGRAFRRDEAEAQARCDELLGEEAALRRRAHPDPAAARLIAGGPTSRLWERRCADADFLDVRVGLADAPARLALTRAGAAMPAPTLPLIPLRANLRDGPLGICGPSMTALAAARWAVLQLAALHSPADLRIVALLGDAQSEQWRWLRWLPHTQSVAIDAQSRRLLLEQLRDTAPAPSEGSRGAPEAQAGGPWTVLVVDRAGELADAPGLARLLADGPR